MTTSDSPQKKQYRLVIYPTFANAYQEIEQINNLCKECDQLNVLIKAEGDMDDKKLLGINSKIKVYAGAAWSTIHEFRQKQGWYDTPQE